MFRPTAAIFRFDNFLAKRVLLKEFSHLCIVVFSTELNSPYGDPTAKAHYIKYRT